MRPFRLLNANEIDVRVGSINEKGATLLLYKDARVDMNILDESGVKWKRSHELINGNLFCTISVWDEDLKQWIDRQDVGTESNTEKEKGQASDAFKRAGFNFGIGRELYTAPFIWVAASDYKGFERAGKYGTYDKFFVSFIEYDENREISRLEVINRTTKNVVYRMGEVKPKSTGEIRNRQEEVAKGAEPFNEEADTLKRAKVAINEQMEAQGYTLPAQKKAIIQDAIGKTTIDNLNDADAIADALDNLKEEG